MHFTVSENLGPNLKSETIYNSEQMHIVYYQCRLFICFSQHSFCQSCRRYVHLKGCCFYPWLCVSHPGTPLYLRQMSPPDLSIKPTHNAVDSISSDSGLAGRGDLECGQGQNSVIGFSQAISPLQKGHIFLSFSRGLQGYR